LRKHLAGLEAERLAAVEEAEHAARSLAESLTRVLKVTTDMARTAHAITGDAAPVVLAMTSLATRMAGRLSAVMQTIPGHKARLGGIEWRGASLYPADQDWRTHEEKVVAPHIKPLITERQPNGADSDQN
jgi:hypothetical protein